MDLSLSLLGIALLLLVVIAIIWWMVCRSSGSACSKSNTASHTPHSQPSMMTHAARKEEPKNRVEVETKKPLTDAKDFPRHNAQVSVMTPAPEAKQVRKVEVESMASLFSPQDRSLAELGMSEEELKEELEKYEKKRTFKQRRLPVNKNFSMSDYNSARNYTRSSIKLQQVGDRSEIDHRERGELIRKALSKRNKDERGHANVDVLATASSDQPLPGRRGGESKLVYV